MSELAVREPTPLMLEEKPFLHQPIIKVYNETKGRYIGLMVTHLPESMEGMATLVRDNKVKTLVLEDSPGLMEVFEGTKTKDAYIRERILNMTDGKVDSEKHPEIFNIPQYASYRRRCEILLELKKDNPDLKIVIVDPYYDKEAVGPKGETYDYRMKLDERIKLNTGRMDYALENVDSNGKVDVESAMEHAKFAAMDIGKQLVLSDDMTATAVAKKNLQPTVAIERGEGHMRLPKSLEADLKGNDISLVHANKEVIDRVFKEDKNFYPPLLQLANQYIEKGEALEKDVADLLAARACASALMFGQELEKLLKEGKRMTAEQDYEIIRKANSLKTVDDCIREINELQKIRRSA